MFRRMIQASTGMHPDVLARQNADPVTLKRQNALVMFLLCALVLVVAGLRSATRPLWFDEIATEHIAASTNWHQLLLRSRAVDLHPPLHAALVRLSYDLLSPHEFASRVPSLISYCIASCCLFTFLRRRVTLSYACFGALLLLGNDEIARYATECRPYAVLLASVTVGVLAFDNLSLGKSILGSRIVLAVALTVMLQTHLFGTVSALAFIAAAAAHSLRQRRVDWWTLAAVLLPWLSCITYVELLRIQVGSAAPPLVFWAEDRTSLRKGLGFYHHFLYIPLAPLTKLLAVWLLCLRFFPTQSFLQFFRLKLEQVVLLVSLFAVPLLITLGLKLRAPDSGFYNRYAIAAACPAILFLTGLVAWRAGQDRWLGIFCTFAALTGMVATFPDTLASAREVAHHGLLASPPQVSQTGGIEKVCPSLPLVVNDAFEFLEFDNRLAQGSIMRMIYAYDPEESLRLEGENVSNSATGMAKTFGLQHHVEYGPTFLAQHPSFILTTDVRGHVGWLVDYLKLHGAHFDFLGDRTIAADKQHIWYVRQASAPDAGPAPCALDGRS